MKRVPKYVVAQWRWDLKLQALEDAEREGRYDEAEDWFNNQYWELEQARREALEMEYLERTNKKR